ncbi:hypothetical protein ACWKSP_38705 [Micromonosporaceae bacterium Da 78-11]
MPISTRSIVAEYPQASGLPRRSAAHNVARTSQARSLSPAFGFGPVVKEVPARAAARPARVSATVCILPNTVPRVSRVISPRSARAAIVEPLPWLSHPYKANWLCRSVMPNSSRAEGSCAKSMRRQIAAGVLSHSPRAASRRRYVSICCSMPWIDRKVPCWRSLSSVQAASAAGVRTLVVTTSPAGGAGGRRTG